MISLQGRAIGMLGSGILFALMVYFLAIRGEPFAHRPEAREPNARTLERMVSGTTWSTGDVQFLFARDGQMFSGGRNVGTWRALDGSLRIRSERGEVTYAEIDGGTLTIGPDRLTHISGQIGSAK
jgi:hypothetical protein